MFGPNRPCSNRPGLCVVATWTPPALIAVTTRPESTGVIRRGQFDRVGVLEAQRRSVDTSPSPLAGAPRLLTFAFTTGTTGSAAQFNGSVSAMPANALAKS